jgi:hypothetical protein
MDLTSNGGRDRHRGEQRSALRREMIESLLVLAVLIVLAIVARLPGA